MSSTSALKRGLPQNGRRSDSEELLRQLFLPPDERDTDPETAKLCKLTDALRQASRENSAKTPGEVQT